jgi:hypothetical protein
MDTYPAEGNLTPNNVNTTTTAYVPVSMVCTHLTGSCVFQFFVKRKMVESVLKVRRIELVRKAEPAREDTTSSDFPSVARRVSAIFDLG